MGVYLGMCGFDRVDSLHISRQSLVIDYETDQIINAKPKIFVILERGLLFLEETPATVLVEDRLVAEKASC